MDRYFDTDNFERLLKDKSDEFKMYPTKRVWYSIYNNLHPGRKWPSVAMSITLIAILLTVGYMNTENHSSTIAAGNTTSNNSLISNNASAFKNDDNTSTSKTLVLNAAVSADNSLTPFQSSAVSKDPVFTMPGQVTVSSKNNTTVSTAPAARTIRYKSASIKGNSENATANGLQSAQQNHKTTRRSVASAADQPVLKLINETIYQPIAGSINQTDDAANNPTNLAAAKENTTVYTLGSLGVDDNGFETANDQKQMVFGNTDILDDHTNQQKINAANTDAVVKKLTPVITVAASGLTQADKEWIEQYGLYNRPARNKWQGKLSWQAWATPSIVYRTLSNNAMPSSIATPISFPGGEINTGLNQKPSIGLETGLGFQYALLKSVKLKAGLQVNFTRYNAMAFENSHPIATTLTLNNYGSDESYDLLKTTPYSINFGLTPVKLHNQTVQLSIPVGVDLKIAGNDNLQWNIGATLQPTILLSASSYLISSDRRNYVEESSMLNRFNLNAGFETFISYKSGGFTWQVGPQFRTQIFTTNSRQYAVEERLLNYGFKFGVSKVIR